MAVERIAATGLTIPFPEISGAEPRENNVSEGYSAMEIH